MKLVIISHTAHYINKDGKPAGWGPTIREIDCLAELFDSVVHVAPFHEGPAPESTLPYSSSKISFTALRPSGGSGLMNKIGILLRAPSNVQVIAREMDKADWVHVRLPTNLGLYVLPLLSFKHSVRRWVKYAGNWIQKNPPLSYGLQRAWLARNWQHSPVTINGRWPDQPAHLLSFENPCLTEEERKAAAAIATGKNFEQSKTLCFVGVLDRGKGILQLIQSFRRMKNPDRIRKLIVVGDGDLRRELEAESAGSPIPIEWMGYLPRQSIHSVYAQSHFVILPSESEGFPKVIAEGASFGCIPVVTDVSSIGQYVIHGRNGFLMRNNAPETIAQTLEDALAKADVLKSISAQAVQLASQFTFERYVGRIRDEILNPKNKPQAE